MRKYFSKIILSLFFCSFSVGYLFANNNVPATKTYDLIINGAGIDGYFLALEASQKGLHVLVLDKRTSPGYDIAAKRKLWIKNDGIDSWDKNMLDLFFPVEEQKEIRNTVLQSPRKSRSGDELLVFAGSLKKQMLCNLLKNKIDVLLMTDVCGIMTDNKSAVTGVIVASKHGVFSIKGGNYIDATDNNLFTRDLFNQRYSIGEASFVLEFDMVKENNLQEISMSGIGIKGDKVNVHPGKKDKDQYFLEFSFPVKTNDLSKIEQQARFLSMQISKNIPLADKAFAKARLHYTALECSFSLNEKVSDKILLSDYRHVGNKENNYSCRMISERRKYTNNIIRDLSKYTESKTTTTVHYIGGKVAYNETDNFLLENGFSTMLSAFPVELLKVKSQKVPLLVVGAGTAGSLVALGASQKRTPVTIIEYFNDLGGTKTMAGVNDFYFGNQQHEFIKDLEEERKLLGTEYNMALGRSTIPRRFHYLDLLTKNNVNIINGAIMCGVQMENKQLESVFICENGKIKKIDAKLTVDATGDAAVANFAGEEWFTGDSRMGITQNYSHWDVAYRPEKKDYNRDYDIVNSTQVIEYQRGLYLAHSEAHYYDFYPMQAIRESRRPKAVYNITVSDILRDVRYDDIISQARSDYDPHYFANSELSRCGFMLPHFDNKNKVNIPYRAIVPQKIDGLLFSGKAIGQTYNALQFTRMSADVTVLGYVTGLIASEILKQGVQARNFSVNEIQKELIARNYLPDSLYTTQRESLESIVTKLENGNEEYLLKTILEKKDEIVPLLKNSFQKSKNLDLAKALAWFGEKEGQNLIVENLRNLYMQELLEGHSNFYFEVYDSKTIYWKVNQNIGLLAMCYNSESNEIIRKILSETISGGPMVESSDAYTHGRIDLQLIPYFNRIVNLCFYIERNPDTEFTESLNRLLDDENIRNNKTTEFEKTRWRLYSANLELLIATASSRCGSQKGLLLLVDYLDDIHSDFRKFSLNELKSITKEDFGYDVEKWREFLNNNKNFAVCPLKKDIEI